MGDELGQANLDAAELKARAGTDGRELQRPSFDWSMVAADGITLKTPNTIYAGLTFLIAHRNAELSDVAHLPVRVLTTGNASVLLLSKGPDHFGIFNFSDQAQQLHVVLPSLGNPAGSFYNLLCGNQFDFDKLPVAPYEVLWLKRCTG